MVGPAHSNHNKSYYTKKFGDNSRAIILLFTTHGNADVARGATKYSVKLRLIRIARQQFSLPQPTETRRCPLARFPEPGLAFDCSFRTNFHSSFELPNQLSCWT